MKISKSFKTLIITAVLVTNSSCAMISQKATLSPNLSKIGESKLGAAKVLSLEVNDKRDTDKVGSRGVNNMGASITLTDAEGPLTEAFREAFKKQGFNVTKSSGPRSVRVDTKIISYETSMGLVAGTMSARATFEVFAKNNGKSFSEVYRGVSSDESMFVKTAEGNQAQINASVEDAINKIISDENLIDFLTK